MFTLDFLLKKTDDHNTVKCSEMIRKMNFRISVTYTNHKAIECALCMFVTLNISSFANTDKQNVG